MITLALFFAAIVVIEVVFTVYIIRAVNKRLAEREEELRQLRSRVLAMTEHKTGKEATHA